MQVLTRLRDDLQNRDDYAKFLLQRNDERMWFAMDAKIWIGSAGAYNAGRLVGDWFALDEIPAGFEEFAEALRERHDIALSPADGDEMFVFDTEDLEGFFRDKDLAFFVRLGDLIDEVADLMGGHDTPALCHWINAYGVDITAGDTASMFDDSYQGVYPSNEDFAREFYEYAGMLPDSPVVDYVDWGGMWDGILRHEYTESGGYYFADV